MFLPDLSPYRFPYRFKEYTPHSPRPQTIKRPLPHRKNSHFNVCLLTALQFPSTLPLLNIRWERMCLGNARRFDERAVCTPHESKQPRRWSTTTSEYR